jgi:NAD(P)H-hydrate epimerase
MQALSTAQMQQVDHLAVRRYKLPVLLLMENAGRAVAEAARDLARRLGGQRLIVLCGSGNNGGDGVVAARYLHHWGYRVQVLWIKNPRSWSGDIGQHFRITKAFGVRFRAFQGIPSSTLRKSSLLIDALLGTGTRGEIRGSYRTAIETINQAHRPVVAIDIPSGLDADTGKPLGIAVKAKITVTMVAAKKGLLKASARPYVGRLIIADIGIPKKLLPH